MIDVMDDVVGVEESILKVPISEGRTSRFPTGTCKPFLCQNGSCQQKADLPYLSIADAHAADRCRSPSIDDELRPCYPFHTWGLISMCSAANVQRLHFSNAAPLICDEALFTHV